MKMNCKLEVSDETRNALAVLLTGKPVKRLATRDEVGEFIRGALDALTASAPAGLGYGPPEGVPEVAGVTAPERLSTLTVVEQAHADKLTAEGKDASYIRGWLVAGRVIERART